VLGKHGVRIGLGVVVGTRHEVALGGGKVGLEPQRLPKARQRQVHLPLAQQRATGIVAGLGKIRLELKGVLVTADRFVQLVLPLEGISQVAVGLGALGIDP